MRKVLKVAIGSLGVLALTSTVATAQTPPPDAGPGQTPTSTHAKPHKGSKKSGHKKATTKKKKAKKTPQQ
ncbi:MAG TPA: hypothetical protein VFP91_23380 [Vicinamibacterales bacterium]|nr:hypothetical protein [Vicinamibacterales bacterium]